MSLSWISLIFVLKNLFDGLYTSTARSGSSNANPNDILTQSCYHIV